MAFVLYPGDHHRRIYHCSVLCDAEACKDEETTVTREFFHSFKQNFLQSLPVTVIVLVVVVVLVADFHILGAAGRAQGASLCTASVLFSGLSAQQSFPMYFRFLQSLRIR